MVDLTVRRAPVGNGASLLDDSVRALRELGLGSDLQTEMLRHLLHGPRTMTELVELIYGVSRDGEDFSADYMKIRRAIRKLENKGLLSTKIFGRDKPYRLTRYAIEKLYHLARPNGQPGELVSRSDLAVHASTLVSGLATLLLTWQALGEPHPVIVVIISGIFFYLLGISSNRILGLIRRIT